ncbi:MAG: cytochrome P450 [Linnemannia gamsii]|nr:MAG: cytochrome P450 [Linnemannia gamsii]
MHALLCLAVLAQVSELHHSNKYFPEAEKFIPERWIFGESPFPPVQDGTFYPFSAGSRTCIGKNFATMEMRLVIATLIRHYDIGLVKGQRTDYVQYVVTAIATGSYVITMNKRTP